MDIRLFRLVRKCGRFHYKPDVHSFMIDIKDGRAYVEGQFDGIYIEEYYADETKKFYGTVEEAVAHLEKLGAKYETFDM